MKKNTHSIFSKQKGFSLLEAIIVIAIIVTMASIGIPTFSRMLPDMRLRSAANDLYASLQAAKMDAIRNNNSATDATASDIIFDPTGGTKGTYTRVNGTVVDLDEEYEGSVEYGTPPNVGGPSVTFVPVAPEPKKRVIFTARGMANEGAVFLKNTKNNYYVVEVLPSGVIQIKKL